MIQTVNPFDAEQIKVIRQMAVYWQEVRGRIEQWPLNEEAHRVVVMFNAHGANGTLRAAEFCVDPVRMAAYEMLRACKAAQSMIKIMADATSGDIPRELLPIELQLRDAILLATTKG